MEPIANELVVWIIVVIRKSGGDDGIANKGIVTHGSDVTAASVEGVACGGMAIGATIVDEHWRQWCSFSIPS